MKTNKKGISLIVLIITIIVVIILAAAVILTMNNNNPISSAKEATFKSDVRSFQDELAMYISNDYVSKQGQRDTKITTIDNPSLGDMQEYIKSFTSKYVGKFKIVNDELVYRGDNQTEKDWFNSIVGENLGEGTRNKDEAKYNKPYVPDGFYYVTGTVNTGYVIQDNIGNQFVWIPVDGVRLKYEAWCTVGTAYNNSNISDVPLPSGISYETKDVQKYGGFYIGRYEAGVPDNQSAIDGTNSTTSNVAEKPISKKEKVSWTCIDYTTAKANAESMISNNNLKTGLLTGKAWDTTCKWIQNSGKNVTDSRTYGNYRDSISPANVTGYGSKQVTGYSDKWSVNNIYDLAGNVWEWTAEAVSSNIVFRGGCYVDYFGESNPVSFRANVDASSFTSVHVGFRVRLYIL